MIPMRGATPTPTPNQVKITNENTNRKHEYYETWHGQSRESNQVQGMYAKGGI